MIAEDIGDERVSVADTMLSAICDSTENAMTPHHRRHVSIRTPANVSRADGPHDKNTASASTAKTIANETMTHDHATATATPMWTL